LKPYSLTENNAVQYENSGFKCLDLFSRIGAFRHAPDKLIDDYFLEAYNEDKNLAARILFWCRDARQGSGERQTFNYLMKKLAELKPAFLSDNAKLIAELGYWKDLLQYFDNNKVVNIYAKAIKSKDRLACKWAPRKGPNAKKLKTALKMTNKEYRKWLRKFSDTVEQDMSNKLWDEIDYSKVPGQAMRKYAKAYDHHDSDRFDQWKDDDSKASVSASYPHNVVSMLLEANTDDEDSALALAEKQWRNLPDYIRPGENILPMIDVSGSMDGLPMLVAISLGLYLSERNKEGFKDTFLTFSSNPQLLRLENENLREKFKYILHTDWGMNTNLTRAYQLILENAKTYNVKPEDMPTMLLILSDMQFDHCSEKPHLQQIRGEFAECGYEVPKIVFWNLRSSQCAGSPATAEDDGVALVSGFSPALMKAVLACDRFNPLEIMYEALKDIDVNVNNIPSTKSLYHKVESQYDKELLYPHNTEFGNVEGRTSEEMSDLDFKNFKAFLNRNGI
tara:strand:+ start:66 stop:1583 length:1518 start_codon:yes stop_codon:yes gene_type:complete